MGKRKGIMLCYPFEEKRLLKWGFPENPVIVQRKLNGRRCVALADGTLLSSEQNKIISIPHINRAIRDLNLDNCEKRDGELYVHGWSKNEIDSVVSPTVNISSNYEEMQFHMFDTPILNCNLYKQLNSPQYRRLAILNRSIINHPLFIVQSYVVDSKIKLWELLNQFIDEGYEGMVVKSFANIYEEKRSTSWMKFKPCKDDWYTIVGYREEISKDGMPKSQLGSLRCMGDDGTEFGVGSFTLTKEIRSKYGTLNNLKQELWKIRSSLVGKTCHISYQHTSKTVPLSSIFIEVGEGNPELGEVFNPLL